MNSVGLWLPTVGSGPGVQMPVLTAFHLPTSLQVLLLDLEEGAAEEAQLVVTIQDVCGRVQKHTCVWTFFIRLERRCSTGVGTALWLTLGGLWCAASLNDVF
ncbi:hypothetical protein MRX96_025031 [Rhipicephalus microplus]